MRERSSFVSESWSQYIPTSRAIGRSMKKKKKEDDEIAVLPISIADSDGPFYSDAVILYR